MPFRFPGFSALVCITFLAGCGGGGGGGAVSSPGTLTPEDRVADFALMSDFLGGKFNTGYTGQPGQMPTTGTATFTGYMGVVLDTPSGDLSLLGVAELDADFDGQSITGSADSFHGGLPGEYAAYTGSVGFVNGEIGAGVPNDIDFDYSGLLSGQDNTIFLDGSVSGKFKGTPIAGLITEGSGSELLNGEDTASTVTVIAEID